LTSLLIILIARIDINVDFLSLLLKSYDFYPLPNQQNNNKKMNYYTKMELHKKLRDWMGLVWEV
jgi:hypothetical protein